MKSKRSHEGYLMIDNRESPGVSDEIGLAISPKLPLGFGKGMFEAPTVTCSHCQTVVVLNPGRTRDRPYCAKCDHYICDICSGVMAYTGVCKTFEQIINEVQEQAATTLT
jgi:hypothetical protein